MQRIAFIESPVPFLCSIANARWGSFGMYGFSAKPALKHIAGWFCQRHPLLIFSQEPTTFIPLWAVLSIKHPLGIKLQALAFFLKKLRRLIRRLFSHALFSMNAGVKLEGFYGEVKVVASNF